MFIFFKATILNSINFKHFYFFARRVTNTILREGEGCLDLSAVSCNRLTFLIKIYDFWIQKRSAKF
ncbi:Uncharacterised protein [Klebsiella variicola]|nr:Uncharacterised protein [Klebsiella variicola]SAU14918.1 Uncharacterised protein [Klebsiella variicola]